jgi:hypothetical protein
VTPSWVIRMGLSLPADAAFEAWTSGDLSRMIAALDSPTNLVDRHFLLQGIVQATYKRRSEVEMRQLCKKIGYQHVAELKDIAPALRVDFSGLLPRIVTFQSLATVLVEDGRYEEAIQLCRQAIALGLSDGTKGGYDGRIAKIQKLATKDKKVPVLSPTQ